MTAYTENPTSFDDMALPVSDSSLGGALRPGYSQFKGARPEGNRNIHPAVTSWQCTQAAGGSEVNIKWFLVGKETRIPHGGSAMAVSCAGGRFLAWQEAAMIVTHLLLSLSADSSDFCRVWLKSNQRVQKA